MQPAVAGSICYWAADPALAGYVTGYHRYDVAFVPGVVHSDAFFPSVATIRIALRGSSDWSVSYGPRNFSPVPATAFVGPTSYAGYTRGVGGTLVGVGLLPAGWARMFGGDASRFANRVVPLAQVDVGGEALAAALEQSDDPVAVLDAWLLARLDRAAAPDPRIAALQSLFADPATTRIEAVAEQLALAPRALAALTRFNFGFTPKLLLRRTRFLRALSAVLQVPDDGAEAVAAAGYWDRSHFLRDCHLFLGCSVRDFNKRRGGFSQAAMAERARVLGTPV